MYYSPRRTAFSMVELMFVIIILGIVSSIGAELIVKVYQGYIIERAQHTASIKTELATQQIANRLKAAIPGTIVRRTAKSGGTIEDINYPITLGGDDYIILQWVGADMDSFSATATPGWSGLIDLANPANTINLLSTPGSDLITTSGSVIGNLAGGIFPTYDLAIFFPNDTTAHTIDIATTTPTAFGLQALGATRHVSEHYKLAWTSYALSIEIDALGEHNLYLYHNFVPDIGVDIPLIASKSLLLKNISTFKFAGAGSTIRFKLCKDENIGEDFNVTSCKEKAVF